MITRLPVALLATLAAATALAAADAIRVVSLVKDQRVQVSFTMEHGFTEDLRAAIRSGLPTTISYDVDLRLEVAGWFDKTLQSSAVSAIAQYDNLTRRYRLSRTVDGRGEEPTATDDEEAVRRWLTTFERLPLFTTDRLEANVEYYVRVRARSRPWIAWFFWPWDRGTASGIAKFTFIQ
ncbi:MAG: DUF4390 domain-containing protein [Acidobacteria bacterium]|nr:DUF4390 domain-containing protein [Acidobacteriota bacterium]